MSYWASAQGKLLTRGISVEEVRVRALRVVHELGWLAAKPAGGAALLVPRFEGQRVQRGRHNGAGGRRERLNSRARRGPYYKSTSETVACARFIAIITL